MSDNIDILDQAVVKTNIWLKVLAERLGTEDRHRAYRVLRAVLHALRDRVGPEVAAHLSAQLPVLVRGVFYEGWDPTRTPVRMSFGEFLARVEGEALLKGTTEAEDGARAVIALLWEELSDGIIEHLIDVLPGDFAAIF